VVAKLNGELDVSNADDVAAAIRSRISNQAVALVIDLTGVRFVDSSVLAALFELGRRLRSRRQQLRVVVPRESHIRPVVELVNLGTVAGLDDSIEAAMARLRPTGAPER
jgi:anti-anti-sigma factor